MHACPTCQSRNIQRSRSRSRWEAWRKEITGKRLFRCRSCGWRGWRAGGVDAGPFPVAELSGRNDAPEPPNLKETALARTDLSPSLDMTCLD
jgi:hypothetical protein